MQPDRLLDAAAIVAYQDVTLTELQRLFDLLDFDLADVLEREARIGDDLDDLDSEFSALRARLTAMGISIPAVESGADAVVDPRSAASPRPRPRYDVPLPQAEGDFGKLAALAKARLEQLGIDLDKDPLQQVLPDGEIARILRSYAEEHGDISWDETDWAVTMSAGALATIADIVIVRTPRDIIFRGNGRTHSGSPLTKWLGEQSEDIHQKFFKQFEQMAKVPYDASSTARTMGRVSGMWPKNHRLKSPGHDPLAGFLFGVLDLMRGTGTYIDGGKLIQVPTEYDPVGLIEAFLVQAAHLLSDVATPAGLPAPLFTLLQLGDVASPFVHAKAGVQGKASWAEISQYMYLNGYDLRHFLSMGTVPAIVSAVIRGYWILKSYATGGS